VGILQVFGLWLSGLEEMKNYLKNTKCVIEAPDVIMQNAT
jgi:hypothetical protein